MLIHKDAVYAEEMLLAFPVLRLLKRLLLVIYLLRPCSRRQLLIHRDVVYAEEMLGAFPALHRLKRLLLVLYLLRPCSRKFH